MFIPYILLLVLEHNNHQATQYFYKKAKDITSFNHYWQLCHQCIPQYSVADCVSL